MTPTAPPLTQTLLVVDDVPENLTVLGELLQPYYRVRVANSGARALQVAASAPKPDLILLDVMMPGMDGYAVLSRLRDNPDTGGLGLGAADYITKPVRPAIVLTRVRAQLELKQARDWLKDQNAFLEAEVARRMAENQLIQEISIRALARLAEIRDPETGNHLRRTQGYIRALANHLKAHPRFADALQDATVIEVLVKSAPLHDIGKVGIPDHILLKPGKLTPEEWGIMKTHARLGFEAIEQAERDAEQPVAFLAVAKEIAHYHHEKWDGSGYPEGLAGEAIPLSARLMALADVFDALISRRVYKPPLSMDQAVSIISEGQGRHFDPDMVDAFFALRGEFETIAQRYADRDADLLAKQATFTPHQSPGSP